MATPTPISERSLYEPVRVWLEQILKEKYASFHLEITANRQFSNVLQSQIDDYRELIFAFLNEAAPDISPETKKLLTIIREIFDEEGINEDHPTSIRFLLYKLISRGDTVIQTSEGYANLSQHLTNARLRSEDDERYINDEYFGVSRTQD